MVKLRGLCIFPLDAVEGLHCFMKRNQFLLSFLSGCVFTKKRHLSGLTHSFYIVNPTDSTWNTTRHKITPRSIVIKGLVGFFSKGIKLDI
ncbi:hypothetical protein LINGRAPRIM_LOCUS1965 [Linum grandiflorum]